MKLERVYREMLFSRFQSNNSKFTERGLATTCMVSVGLVNSALKPMKRMGAIIVHPRWVELVDPWKALVYWCSIRDLRREVVYSTRLSSSVREIETLLPRGSMPTAYTAYVEMFDDTPAEYSEVYAYGDPDLFVGRFGAPTTAVRENLIVLKSDPHLMKTQSVPLPQVYADLWNIDSDRKSVV